MLGTSTAPVHAGRNHAPVPRWRSTTGYQCEHRLLPVMFANCGPQVSAGPCSSHTSSSHSRSCPIPSRQRRPCVAPPDLVPVTVLAFFRVKAVRNIEQRLAAPRLDTGRDDGGSRMRSLVTPDDHSTDSLFQVSGQRVRFGIAQIEAHTSPHSFAASVIYAATIARLEPAARQCRRMSLVETFAPALIHRSQIFLVVAKRNCPSLEVLSRRLPPYHAAAAVASGACGLRAGNGCAARAFVGDLGSGGKNAIDDKCAAPVRSRPRDAAPPYRQEEQQAGHRPKDCI